MLTGHWAALILMLLKKCKNYCKFVNMKRDCYQKKLFDDLELEKMPHKEEIIITLSEEICTKFQNYKLENKNTIYCIVLVVCLLL